MHLREEILGKAGILTSKHWGLLMIIGEYNIYIYTVLVRDFIYIYIYLLIPGRCASCIDVNPDSQE